MLGGLGLFVAALAWGWDWWWCASLALAAGILLRHNALRRPGRDALADRRQLAVLADLMAACLDAGLGVATALTAAVDATVSGAVRRRGDDSVLEQLPAVAAMLSLGADTEHAWAAVDTVAELRPLADAVRRAAQAGIPLATAVREFAAEQRRTIAMQYERSSGRSGVLMTAPLGLCFLPAFLCLGLAPVIIGLVGTLGIF